jgi:ATP-dependent RNA helicase HrpA
MTKQIHSNNHRNVPTKRIYQTRDTARMISLRRRISKKGERPENVEKLKADLEQLLADSDQVSAQIKASIPRFELPKELPISEKSDLIVNLLKDNQVVVIAGETGCGKTTQLPKICLTAGLGVRGKIAHTQPRRVAATSVSARIASELNSPLGEFVGYSVRFADKLSDRTRIKLMTDGVLLAELQSDPFLSQYEVIIIDEAHERSLNIDFLLGFLKKLLKKRRDLKVLVTSATIDPKSFSDYFDDAPIVLVEGRTFPVSLEYRPIEESISGGEDPLLTTISQSVESCMAKSPGDILIFSNGEGEIKNISQHLQQAKLENTKVLPLYARLGIKEQQAIFKSSNQRKIIIATNVAETSLTIPNIVFVIDIGTARISRYSQRNKIQQLPIEKISQASAEQRKGRCGRICPGTCVRLYSQEDFEARPEYTLAEIKRTNLSSVVLRLSALKVREIESFPFIEAPDERQWKVAFNLLFELGAMDVKRHISDIGRRMSKLPLDPQLARVLLTPNLIAVEELLVVCSFLSVRDVRMRPHDKPQKAAQLHQQFIDSSSDVMTVIKMWRILAEQKKNLSSSGFRRWCGKNLINFVGWLEWRNIYSQNKQQLRDLGVSIHSAPASHEQVHQGLIVGFISHIMTKTQERYYQGARGIKIWLHPSSLFFKSKANWLLSAELFETDKLYARMNIPIQPEWLESAAPHLVKENYQDIHWRKNKGQAAAFVNRTLFGLPIVNQRLVDYSQIDPKHSRELFLINGLAEDCINQKLPFLEHNRKMLLILDEEEEKLRTSNVKLTSKAIAELYEEKLPTQINNVFQLKRWLKKDWNKRNELLSFSKDKLSHREVVGIEDYPSQITIRGVVLNLSYRFSPGEKEDGVFVDIPRQMLNQFKQSDFDWLVPGYLEEKILVVIKQLPKNYRKQMIPLADTALDCSKKILAMDYLTLPFKRTLINVLKEIRNVELGLDDINLLELPTHLNMKFSSDSHASSKQTAGRIESSLEKLKNITLASGDSCDSSQTQSKPERLYRWPEQNISLETTSELQGQTIRKFQGLKAYPQYAQLETFSSLEDAAEEHKKGVARLLLIDNLRFIKEMKNGWPERQKIEKYNLRFGGFAPLLDWLVLSEAVKLVTKSDGSVSTSKDFQDLCREFKHNIRRRLSEQLLLIEKLLVHMSCIYEKLSQLKKDVYRSSVEDIKSQLSSLWQQRHFLNLAEELMPSYARYFQAIDARIDRIRQNFPKEQQALNTWSEWNDWWLELSNENLSAELVKELMALFWLLQEYKISLFASNVKTTRRVSAKKLQKAFEQFEDNLVNQ